MSNVSAVERRISDLCLQCWDVARTQPRELFLTQDEMDELAGCKGALLGFYVNPVTAEPIPVKRVEPPRGLIVWDEVHVHKSDCADLYAQIMDSPDPPDDEGIISSALGDYGRCPRCLAPSNACRCDKRMVCDPED